MALDLMPGVASSLNLRQVIREVRKLTVEDRAKKRVLIEWWDLREARGEIGDIVGIGEDQISLPRDDPKKRLKELKRRSYERLLGKERLQRLL